MDYPQISQAQKDSFLICVCTQDFHEYGNGELKGMGQKTPRMIVTPRPGNSKSFFYSQEVKSLLDFVLVLEIIFTPN